MLDRAILSIFDVVLCVIREIEESINLKLKLKS